MPRSGPGYTEAVPEQLPDRKMTALLVSFLVWTIVVFMGADKAIRVGEKRALVFFAVLGTTLTVIGLWQFEVPQIASVSLRDWVLIGFFPIFVLSLFLRSRLIRLQSTTTGKACSVLDLNLAEIPDRRLVRKFRVVNTAMWLYAAMIILVQTGLIVG
jgi:hypothetical protein